MRKLACLLPLLAWSLPAATTKPKPATAKHSKKKVARKSKSKSKNKRPRAAVVHVSPQVRHVAFETVSARATHPTLTLENAGALVPFFEQITRPPENGSLHILHYGDSHTASDDWAAEMRQALQRKFGSGGPGFTLAGRPFRGYRRFDIKGDSSRGWHTDGLVGRPGDGVYGLSGVSLTAQSAGQTVSLVAECEQLELHYLQQPGGGQLQFSVDGVPVDTIDSNGDMSPGIYRYSPQPGSHEYLVSTLDDAPVRLFGWVAQNHSGITYETLGINGAQAGLMLDWNQSVLAGEIAARDPAMVIVAYGTNEALSRSWTADEYRKSFTEVIRRIRADAPVASILIVGPPDCLYRYRGRRLPFPHLDDVIEIQREVAEENGCAFWDWRLRMGGPGSVKQWVQAGLSQADYVHFTGAGYRLVGDMLMEELMAQYTRFLAVRADASNGQ